MEHVKISYAYIQEVKEAVDEIHAALKSLHNLEEVVIKYQKQWIESLVNEEDYKDEDLVVCTFLQS